ncbi:hypothetical protein SAMN06265361_10510 [Laceyella tengchongensis]|uniref:Minor tail protein n=1 Tax=Laceyella tengchongensis TaxID=574699 RepID=A0AA45WQH8_9BACL|nr:hypothetical protein [Laceyella tengchongensis]SMP25010.1 hypothetical protein SAMN06265361_10510 [Laceyella tengchongensis]
MPATLKSFPWDSQASLEADWRDLMKFFRSPGVIARGSIMDTKDSDLSVTAGTGLHIRISNGYAYIQGHLFKHSGSDYLMSISPNNTGANRTDTVVLRADFTANTIIYAILENSTTLTQTATIWEIPLAQLTIPNGATDASQFIIKDLREFTIPYALAPSTKRVSTATQVLTSSGNYTTLSIETTSWYTTTSMMDQSDLSRIIAPQDGFFFIYGRVQFVGGAAASRRGVRLLHNGFYIVAVNQVYTNGSALDLSCTGIAKMAKGDFIQIQGMQDSGSNMTINLVEAAATWMAPINIVY